MTLTRKIVLFIAITLPVVLVAIYSFLLVRKNAYDQLFNEKQAITSLSSLVLKEKLDAVKDLGISFATRIGLSTNVEKGQWESAIALMAEIPDHFSYIDRVFITDTTGTLRADVPFRPDVRGMNFSQGAWYHGVAANWEPYFSGVYKRTANPQLVVISLAIPIKNEEGNVKGILVLQILVNRLLDWSNNELGNSGLLYVVDQNGHAATYTKDQKKDSIVDYRSVPAVQKALQGAKSVEVLFNPISKENQLTAYEQIPYYGWAVIFQERADAAISESNTLLYIFIFYSFIILLALLVAWYIIRQMEARKEGEKKLDRYTSLLGHAHVIVWDMDNRIVFWSAGMEKLYLWKKEEVIGQKSHVLFSTKFSQPLKEIEDILFSGNEWQGELQHVRKDGSIIFVSSHWYLHRDHNKEPVAIVQTNNDITDLKKAEFELRELKNELEQRVAERTNQVIHAQQSLSTLIERISDGFIALDKDFQYVYANKKIGEITHRDPQSLIGKNVWAEFPEAVGSATYQAFNKAMNEQQYICHTDHFEPLNLWQENHIYPSPDGLSVFIRDISDRKIAEAQLIEKEQRFRVLVENSTDAIFLTDINLQPLYLSPSVERMTGFSLEERKAHPEIRHSHPDDRPRVEMVMNAMLKKPGVPVPFQIRFLHSSGDYIWIEGLATNLLEEKAVKALVFNFRDITEARRVEQKLVENEKRFRALVENAMDIISMTDKEGKVIYVSPALEKLTGFTLEEMKGKPSVVIMHPDHKEESRSALEWILSNPGVPFARTNRFQNKDGNYIWVEGTVINLLHDENVQAIVSNYHDVTERKTAEEKLKLSQVNLKAIFENISEGITLIDRDGTILAVNEKAIEISILYDSTELAVGKNILDYVKDQRVDFFNDAMQRVIHGDSVEYDHSFGPRNGKTLWLNVTMSPVEVDGHNIGICLLSKDITERKAVEEKIRLSEQTLKIIFENISEGITLIDLDGTIRAINRKAIEFTFQHNAAELKVGKNLFEYMNEKRKEYFKDIISKVSNGEHIEYDRELTRMDGGHDWLSVAINPVEEQNHIVGICITSRDITARKDAEEKLSANEQRFRALVENDFSITALMNEKFESVYRSPSAEAILGWTEEDRKGMAPDALSHPDDIEYIRNQMKNTLLNPEKVIHLAFRGKHKNGTYIWLEGVAVNRLADPHIHGIITNLRDISERKLAEEKLATQDQRFRALIENSHDMLTLINADGKIQYISPAVERTFNIASDENQTLNMASIIYQDDAKTVEDLLKKVLETPGVPIPSALRNKRKDGSYIWVEGTITNMLHVPNVNALVANFRDITERKRLENQRNLFGLMINSSEDGIVGKTLESVVTSWNYGAEKLFGYSAEEVIGKSISLIIPPELLDEERQTIEKIKHGEFVDHFETRRLRKDGKSIYVSLKSSPIRTDDNVIVGASSIARDITEKKEAERQIYQLNAELEEKVAQRTAQLESVNKELEGFTYSVSHDLRSPLRIIDGFGQILLEDHIDRLDAEGKTTLLAIMQNAKRMGQLIDDLLNFSRLGRAELRLSRVDMNLVLKDALIELQSSGVSLPAQLIIGNLSPGRADRSLIKQVWINLISNAVKYTGKKSIPAIEIGMKKEMGRDVYFIRDNGAGFSMNYYHKLFGVFQRLHKQEDFPGTGVGLALVHKIITRHGGAVWAESKLGAGAVFYFSLNGEKEDLKKSE